MHVEAEHSTPTRPGLTREVEVSFAWSAQIGPQCDAIVAREIAEMLYGGAAGGGKSDFLLGDFLQDVPTYGKHWRGVLFRRTYGELEELIDRSRDIYPQTGATYNESKHMWTWPNGATLRFRYLEQDRHRTRYQGSSFTWIGWDELTHWPTDRAYKYLKSRLRSAAFVPAKRIRCTSNPGGVGHHWVKAFFVSPDRRGYLVITDPLTKMQRVFIPAKLSDNKILTANDPGYWDRLSDVGSIALVKALRDGDWDVVDGAFFDNWSHKNIIRPCGLPKKWLRFRAMDWGSASPLSVGWYAVVQDDFTTPDGILIPRGSLIRYREWYGTKNPNESGLRGLKLNGEQIGEEIAKREKKDSKLSYAVLDPATFKIDSGPSIAEQINNVLFKHGLIQFHKADNTRVPRGESKDRRGPVSGWDQMRLRISGVDGVPRLFVFDTGVALIRQVGVVQHDPAVPEDLDTNSEDHALDECRYACSSRPWLKQAPEAEEVSEGYVSPADDRQETESIKLL